ncbi:hypothetical protein SARC_02552 [Sphaeroforma arctica JP610]|uniref:Choline/carnitine/betaine transporter n=1 Tax=Sphaeroforma arctica JP610 TaxID=667725 RepID=A0A0L0G8P7_9EUKA|nr:hypothetical protein SARC_02552 [Sphaeroforma arctica JP610]KNC85256.1 hypothetical protein SARC_02552 [Sphaeroforma arctica JP610]|eukprot:XP_014159158.1 hypothetical protein SARC_02552 [Sphaeroforma arctica JP610]
MTKSDVEAMRENSSAELAIEVEEKSDNESESEKSRTSRKTRTFWRGYSDTEDIIGMADVLIPNDYAGDWTFEHRALRWMDYLCLGVTIPSLIFALTFVLVFAIFPDTMQSGASTALTWVGANLGWFYILCVAVTILILVYIAASSYGEIKLGQDDSEPEFSMGSWIAMLFSAGVGVGMVFYGSGEPLFNTVYPPVEYYGGAAQWAVATTVFHWGVHGWAIYCGLALPLAYFSHRLKLPLTLRSSMYPLLGRYTAGWMGHIVDTVAVFGTIGGLCTSLGLGVLNIVGGLDFVFDIRSNPDDELVWLQAVIVGLTTLMACISISTGLRTGVRLLSNANACMALFLCFMVFILSDPVHLLRMTVENVGMYVQILIMRTWRTGAGDPDELSWITGWSVFYWGWFYSWSPFVAVFVARISKGRTIRQFIICVMGAPTLASIVWFSVLGQAGIDLLEKQVANGADPLNAPVDTISEYDIAIQIYVLIKGLGPEWLFYVLSVGTMVLLMVFFVTSSDSGTLVIDSMACGGQLDSPVLMKCVWCVLTNACALVLLISGGSNALVGLQAASVIIGLPVAIVYIFIMLGLLAGLRRDPYIVDEASDKMEKMHTRFTYKDVYEGKGVPRRNTLTVSQLNRDRSSFISLQ